MTLIGERSCVSADVQHVLFFIAKFFLVALFHIGILTACVAFIVIRLEMALFDLKSGFCPSSLGATEKRCKDWMTWSRYFAKFGLDESGWGAFGAYYGIAVSSTYQVEDD